MSDESAFSPSTLIETIGNSVIDFSNDAVEELLQRAVAKSPDRSPSDVLEAVDRMYLAGVTTAGAAVGGIAAVPGAGTAASVPATLVELTANLQATLAVALTYARVHGLEVRHVERRTTLLLGILAGDATAGVITNISGRVGAHWGKTAVKSISVSTLRQINKVLGRNVVTKWGTKQGIIVLGRAAPFGIGALIGGGANAAMGYVALRAIQRAFGPAPDQFPPDLLQAKGGDHPDNGDTVDGEWAEE